ncbi:Alpha/Beta hydrolase protein [Glomus cerebriforme]|uniref:Alpha/Beta hydrolase protein n=1 Tax=Glomus cerebriforme TaxID=658196 RepID=A0A397STM1_9GLOM|nr:Alpha/Beta hydrolase protein [Glomus cerebriforme]
MNLIKSILIFILACLNVSAVIAVKVPFDVYPPNDGTKSYYVKGENGVKIFVDEKGDPTNTTILFSSAFLHSRTTWDPQWVDPELNKKFHLVRYDYRGLGRSDKPDNENSYSYDINGEDLSAVIRKISSKKKKKIVLVGWSLGIPITLTFMKNHPDMKIDGFIAVCGPVNDTIINLVDPPLSNIIKKSYDKVFLGIDEFMKLFPFKPFSDELHAYLLGNAFTSTSGYRKTVTKPFNLDEFYSSLTIPTLHIIGEKDALLIMEHSLYFASLKKNSKTIIYKNIGHSPSWENTKEFNKDMMKYVSNI